jgi:hypothetical protein
MSRRAGQIVALLAITVLVIVAIWYQNKQDQSLKTSVLNNQYGYGYTSTAGSSAGSVPNSQSLPAHRPQFSGEENGLTVHRYLIAYEKLTVLDALQVPLHVPSISTPVVWSAANDSASAVIVDDIKSTRTAFLAPESDQVLLFELSVGNNSGTYEKVARYEFTVVSEIAFEADVNLDGKYDFQNDLVHLLRNWDSFGNDATRTLALILSRLEE